MEGSSSNPFVSHQTATGAFKFLANLPSCGLFSSTVISSNPGKMQVYICEHDTAPPEDQLIKTNQQNLLIRSLLNKKQKGDSKGVKGIAATASSRKRAADRVLDRSASAKRANNHGSSQQGLHTSAPDRDLLSLTVERLRAHLKERGFPTKG